MRALIILVAVGAGALLSACSGQNSGPMTVTTSATASSDLQLPALPSRIPMGSPDTVTVTVVPKADRPDAKFPNTTQTVWVTGYDDNLNMLEFQLIRRASGGPDNGHYVAVPQDTGKHRLPLTDKPKVLSAGIICRSDGATVGDGGRGTTPCTKDEFLANVKQGLLPLAEIKVDGSGHITAVIELYAP